MSLDIFMVKRTMSRIVSGLILCLLSTFMTNGQEIPFKDCGEFFRSISWRIKLDHLSQILGSGNLKKVTITPCDKQPCPMYLNTTVKCQFEFVSRKFGNLTNNRQSIIEISVYVFSHRCHKSSTKREGRGPGQGAALPRKTQRSMRWSTITRMSIGQRSNLHLNHFDQCQTILSSGEWLYHTSLTIRIVSKYW